MAKPAALALGAGACLLLCASAAPAAKCHAPYGSYAKRLESVCYDVIVAGAGVEVRSVRAANVSAVSNTLDATFGSFASALFSFGVLADYFGGDNLARRNISFARTSPLVVLPNRTADPSWAVAMAIAPSRFPDPLKVPAPVSGAANVSVFPLSRDLAAPLAARHEQLPAPASQADFEQCVADLVAALPNVDNGRFAYDPQGFWSPTFSFFYGTDEFKTFDIECWVQVREMR